MPTSWKTSGPPVSSLAGGLVLLTLQNELYVLKVLRSCKNFEQRMLVYNWYGKIESDHLKIFELLQEITRLGKKHER